MQREVAKKVKLSEIVKGKYVKEEGWNPNYILLESGDRVARINSIAVIVSKNSQGVVIDDGSAQLPVRVFDEDFFLDKFSIGDVILLIGKPREYNGVKYVVPEIIRKIENSLWIEVRKAELTLLQARRKIRTQPLQSITVEETAKEIAVDNAYEKILRAVKDCDSGQGAPVGEVIMSCAISNAEILINEMIKKGELFEISPGKVKILE